MATFSNFVFNVDSQSPAQIGPSLSGSNNTVVFVKTDSTYKTVKQVPNTVFTSLSVTQLTAITTNANISGFYSGWMKYGILVDTKYSGTDYNALVSAYSSPALSTQYNVLTAAILSTSEFGTGKLPNTVVYPSGLLYNEIAGASTNLVTLSVANNIQFKVSTSYDGAQFAVYFNDSSTSLFTANTATTGNQTVGAFTFDNRGPNERRRFAIEI